MTEEREESAEKRPEDQERVPEETTTNLTIESEKEQPLEDAEAIQLEPCQSSKDGVNGASRPTADRDEESQEGLQVAEDTERGSEEKGSSDAEETKQPEVGGENKKKKEESFLMTAAVCSTWIPSVVGKQEQKIFLKAGIASLVTKTTFLAIAIGLSSYDYNLYSRPSLVWCLDESSPLIKTNSSVTYCDFNQNSRWPDCTPDASNYTHITDFADSLEKLEMAIVNFEEEAQKVDNDLFQNEIPSIGLQKIRNLRREVDKFLRRVGLKGLTQKVRICGPEENQVRNWTFVVLVALAVLAALATYHLHKITSYKVISQFLPF